MEFEWNHGRWGDSLPAKLEEWGQGWKKMNKKDEFAKIHCSKS